MTHSKNAYEIRLDVLQMAHNDAWGKFHSLNQKRFEDKNLSIEDYEKIVKEEFPKTSEIIARAEELYAFIEAK
jgi:hypothetical protein